jgi:vacuolar-type H+-ATPase subunit I/STV1
MSEAQAQAPQETAAPAAPETQAVEAAPATESAPEQEAAPATEEEAVPSIDEFAAEKLEDEIFKSEEDYKGVDYKAVMQDLSPEAKKLFHNLRSSFTKKTQSLSDQKKALENAKAALHAREKALFESDFYKSVSEKAATENKDFDPYDTKSFESRIEQEVAKRMTEMMEPMRQAHVLQQQKHKLEQFKAQHPDLETFKGEIVDVLKEHKHMNLEQAYWQVKGRKLAEDMKTQEADLANYKKVAREAGLKVGGASRGSVGGVPKHIMEKDDPVAIYNWIRENKGKVKI